MGLILIYSGLNLLLDYTHHEDENIRSPAIRLVANQLYPLPALTQFIVEHAVSQLNSIATAPKDSDVAMEESTEPVKIKAEPSEEGKPDENGAEGKKEGEADEKEIFTEGEIQRKLFLYFALCTKKHELLTGYVLFTLFFKVFFLFI